MKKQVLIATLALALTACGGGVEKDAEYDDVNELARAYGQATDLECHETANELSDYGWLQTNCGPNAIIMLFESDAKRDEIKQKNPLEDGARWIQGGNWLIESTQYEAEKAHEALGGELLSS